MSDPEDIDCDFPISFEPNPEASPEPEELALLPPNHPGDLGEEGGVFAWVSNTLGPRWGFAAISFGYLQIAIGFIPMLYFVLGALSYILKWPALNEDPITKTIAALIILWALALTQFGGTKYTARIAKVGFFAGILLPAFILIALAAIYLHSGAPVAIEMDSKTFFPQITHY
uniref:IP11322p n=1 Tax=Drosophila melanogaster TaxID=7227 RepID=Q4V6H0_DROME|nr:IP11322p [Drosophila melanogaster]